MTKIKWCIYKNDPIGEAWKELALFPPERLTAFDLRRSTYKNCPAFKDAVEDYFVIRSPVDLDFSWDEGAAHLDVRKGGGLIQERLDDQGEGDPRLITLLFQYIFVAEKDTVMEVFSPSFSEQPLPWHIIPGRYNIHKWVRPVDVTFEFKSKSGRYKVRRGEPLLYIKFHTSELFDKFEFEQVEMDGKIYEQVAACTSLKDYMKGLSLSKIHDMFDKSIIKKYFKWF